jgi:outer membrane protein
MLRTFLAATVLLCAAPAIAQGANAPLPDPLDQSDTFTLAGGGAYIPDYEGSDDYRFIPAVAARGRVSGISFFTRATWLYVDFVGRGDNALEFDVGPIIGVRLNRTGKIKDNFVDDLPERDTAIEVGAFAGVSYHGLTNPYDVLSFRVDVVKDVGSGHKSIVITPTIEFGTPLSRTTYIGASFNADWVGGGYADYYYSIDADDALDSGLPIYDADGGFKNWRATLLVNQSLTGDLTGGLSLFGTGSYSHLGGDFNNSPIVDLRGSGSQWLAAVGLAYTW